MATDRNNYARTDKSTDAAKQCSNSDRSERRGRVTNKPDYDKYGTGKYSDCGEDIDDCQD